MCNGYGMWNSGLWAYGWVVIGVRFEVLLRHGT
jgi:hypothetical protein